LDAAVTAYESGRIDNGNAIADLALDQFVDMRDRSGSRWQRFKKKGSQVLGAFVPGWIPLYDMVSFTRIPYAEALARSRRQATAAWIVAVLLGLLLLATTWLLLED
ncbi:MAG: hypothetical protein VXY94_01590, partial [Planctomycetota bacterium]|nr:hypothetical protein [Planctomycetota bacterium]